MTDAERETLRQGRAARAELEMTDTAFAGLRAAALEALVKCPPDKPERMGRLIACVQTLDAVKDALIRAVREAHHTESLADHTRRLVEAGVIEAV